MNNKSTGAVKVINSATAFENFLKLPVDGFRLDDGSLKNDNSIGRLWTVSVDGTNSYYISFENKNANSNSFGFRAMGIPVRCVGN